MKKLMLVILATAGTLCAQNDIIIDNPQAVFEGKWETSKSAKDRYAGDYRTAYCVAGSPTATATYRPEIVVGGKYNVEVTYPRGDNRSTNAPWLISSAAGVFLTNISQQVSGGKWVRIASGLEFTPGTNGFVRTSNDSGEDKETSFGKPVVVADAVRFVLAGKGSSSSVATQASMPSEPARISSRASAVPGGAPGWRYSFQASQTAGGRIVQRPDQPGYYDGDMVELVAQADKGHVFVGWHGDIEGFENPVKLKMTNNLMISAEFLPEAPGAILESSEATLEGRWATNSQKWVGQRTDAYVFAPAATDRESRATYQPNLPKDGKYDIYIYYLNGSNRATKTSWEILSKTGSTIVEVDQKQNGGSWVLLAAGKDFDAGTKGYVRLTSKAQPIPSVVVADSVAFVYVGPGGTTK